jgi:hypothetical protein
MQQRGHHLVVPFEVIKQSTDSFTTIYQFLRGNKRGRTRETREGNTGERKE